MSLSLTINIVLMFGEICLIIKVYVVITVFYHIVTYGITDFR